MKKLFTLAFALISLTCFATQVSQPTQATSLEGSRYEVVAGNDLTFNLDKFTGRVYQLQDQDNGQMKFQEMFVQQEDETMGKDNGSVTYQLVFENGDCFLTNVNTGKRWKYEYEHILDINFFAEVK